MDIQPILSALSRNRTSAILVVLQIALTMAVVVNAAFIINERLAKMNRDPGIDVDNIITFQSWGFSESYNHESAVTRDLDYLESLPGVVAVTTTRNLPLSGGGGANDYRAVPEQFDADGNDTPTVNANFYYMTEQAVDALGVKLSAGRSFFPEEVVFREANSSEFVPSVIITEALAERLFGTRDALSQTVYDFYGNPAEVVGVIEHMHGAWVDEEDLTSIIIMPGVVPGPFLRYIVRTEPGRRDELIATIEEELPRLDRSRMIRRFSTMSDVLKHAYSQDQSMTILLLTTVILLVSITSLGIIGLASFAVRQRMKQIGTRRAIGATRAQIMHYFMVENWLVTTIGVTIGTAFSIAFNVWLVDTYDLEKLDWAYIPVGIVFLWILGQLAVLVPAIRASSIPPAVATRSV